MFQTNQRKKMKIISNKNVVIRYCKYGKEKYFKFVIKINIYYYKNKSEFVRFEELLQIYGGAWISNKDLLRLKTITAPTRGTFASENNQCHKPESKNGSAIMTDGTGKIVIHQPVENYVKQIIQFNTILSKDILYFMEAI